MSITEKKPVQYDVVGKRPDSVGLFWNEPLKKKPPPKEKVKCIPPDPVWERPGYYPNLEEAIDFEFNMMNEREMIKEVGNVLVFDIECYPNYFLIAFKSIVSGKTICFEMCGHDELDIHRLKWVMQHFVIVGFNSNKYDLPIVSIALAGGSCEQLWDATERLIVCSESPYFVVRSFKAQLLQCDHIDLIEVAPLKASLKLYGGRLKSIRLQDLPFKPGTMLDNWHITIVRWYCINDLELTEDLLADLDEQIVLRGKLGASYGLDLRSKSDAQIAEAVLTQEIQKVSQFKLTRPTIVPGTSFYYQVPDFVQFQTPALNRVLSVVRNAQFVISDKGSSKMPDELKKLTIPIGGSTYKMGIGGLHSMEKSRAVMPDANHFLSDKDVTSYYPRIILNCNLYPEHLGTNFLAIFNTIVEQRLAAKRSGDKQAADTLKITINGSFGKLGSKYSMLYSPNLLIQVTLTGQLSLLMLIEALEMQGISVVSANTDGLVILCSNSKRELLETVCASWEKHTQFGLETTNYRAVYSRDVNNYMAITTNGKIKAKGVLKRPDLRKNPTNEICIIAIEKFLTEGAPIEDTVRACDDITKFATVRTVKGGAVKNGEFLGKAIRWYYASNEEGNMVYALSGKKVPRSEGAKPLMLLPNDFPQDVNFAWYEAEANSMLTDMGASPNGALRSMKDPGILTISDTR